MSSDLVQLPAASAKDQFEPGSDFMFVCLGELFTSCQEIFTKLI
jgi:hypothetical protein